MYLLIDPVGVKRLLRIVNRISGLLLVAITLISPPVFAADSIDGVWRDVDETALRSTNQRQILPQQYRAVVLDWTALERRLNAVPMERTSVDSDDTVILTLPLPDGGFGRFRIEESPIMEPELGLKFPEIKTYRGQGLDDSTASVRFDRTPAGFHAMIRSASGAVFIDPQRQGDITRYISYYKKDYLPADPSGSICHVKTDNSQSLESHRGEAQQRASGDMLRTYRLVVAATGEYTAFHGGTVAGAMDAIVTAINRVNGIYESELAIRMTLVADNNLVIYTDAGTDPYTNSSLSTMLGENQANIDAVIGSANYDIGHVFGTTGGGIATLRVPCDDAIKARGVTGSSNPVGDPFYVDLVAHEFGHQWGGNHTFNGTAGSCNGARTAAAAYEPGSGSTIQAYAGICGSQNLQSNSDTYFHAISYDEINNYIDNNDGGTCGTSTATGNNPPTVEAGQDYTIPISTPFELCGSGTDPDGDALTHGWEQFDLGPAGAPGAPMGNAPIFRSFTPVTSPCRTFPRLSDLLANTTNIGETLPTYGRGLNFRLTTRDNRTAGGGVNHDNTVLTVHGAAGPFLVTDPNTAETWTGSTPEIVAWNVSNTNLAPITCNAVNIALSNDGGNNYQLNLLGNTPNDGMESVFVPSFNTTTSRVRVRCADNIFFDVSNAELTINPDVGCVTDLALPAQTLTDSQYFEARDTISNAAATAFVVSGTGMAIMRTAGTITFRNGFRVQQGGQFIGQIVPGICPI